MNRLALAASLVALTASAAEPLNVTFFGHRAINGYDPVAYFLDGTPTPGKAELFVEWKGGTWLFATAAHRDAFKATPEKFAPQYGGFCAYAMARGERVGIDPAAWAIVDGKLYLNYSLDVKKRWEAERSRFITEADARWAELVKR